MSTDVPAREDRQHTSSWRRVTFRLPESMLDEIESQVEDGTFANRSEAIRSHLDRAMTGPGAPQDADTQDGEHS